MQQLQTTHSTHHQSDWITRTFAVALVAIGTWGFYGGWFDPPGELNAIVSQLELTPEEAQILVAKMHRVKVELQTELDIRGYISQEKRDTIQAQFIYEINQLLNPEQIALLRSYLQDRDELLLMALH